MFFYNCNAALASDLFAHLTECDHAYNPKLSSRVDLSAYSRKLVELANTFEAWQDEKLVGLVAAYINHQSSAYITDVSVNPSFSHQGIAKKLLRMCIDEAVKQNCKFIELHVSHSNGKIISLYTFLGFQAGQITDNQLRMTLVLNGVNR